VVLATGSDSIWCDDLDMKSRNGHILGKSGPVGEGVPLRDNIKVSESHQGKGGVRQEQKRPFLTDVVNLSTLSSVAGYLSRSLKMFPRGV